MPQYIDIHTHKPRGRNIEIYSLRLGEECKTCHSPYSAGIHPWDVERLWASRENLLERLSAMPAVAVGEIGLDHTVQVDRSKQLALLRRQLQIAVQKDCPVVLHSVKAVGEVLAELKAAGITKAIFHGFTGNHLTAMQIISAGYAISFGERSFRSPKTIDTISRIPLDSLFFETDESDEPIENIYSAAALLRQVSSEQLAEAVEQNYNRLFL